MKLFRWSYGNCMHAYACITAYWTVWQKKIKCLWGGWVTLTIFLQIFFYGFPIPESTAFTSPSCIQSLHSHAVLSVQCDMMKHCWNLAIFVLQSYILTTLQAALTRPATRWEFLNLTADSVSLLTHAKWLGISARISDNFLLSLDLS